MWNPVKSSGGGGVDVNISYPDKITQNTIMGNGGSINVTNLTGKPRYIIAVIYYPSGGFWILTHDVESDSETISGWYQTSGFQPMSLVTNRYISNITDTSFKFTNKISAAVNMHCDIYTYY